MTAGAQSDTYLVQARDLVEDLAALLPDRPFAVRLPGGQIIPQAERHDSPAFSLVLHNPSRLRRMFIPPSELGIGESYIFGDLDIEGDITAAFGFLDELSWPRLSLAELARLAWRMWRLERNGRDRPAGGSLPEGAFSAYDPEGRRHSPDRDQQASRFHYDVSNGFYKLWLDERMVYSCAYFTDRDDTLEAAQLRKLDRICQKLNLQPGERFLDIGCGFGGLLIHAAADYGVQATGISLSQAQTDEARRRIKEAGLSDRCRIEIRHYERFEPDERFDKIASVGMFEHVGQDKLAGYFARGLQMLRPGGLFLLQGGSARPDRRHAGSRWMEWLGRGRNAFMQKYSFPDSRLIDIATVLQTAEQVGFETRDVESLREHYPITLRHWLQRLEQNEAKAVTEVGEVAYRSWRLILAGYWHLLEKGRLTEYQTLFAKQGANARVGLPLTRSG